MHRIIGLAAAVLLVTQIALAAGTSRSISVTGNLSAGAKVSASCTVSSTGQASGTGRLFGTGYSYPFVVNKITTGQGTITLSGYFSVAGSPPMTLTAAVPSGNQTLKYVVNGRTITYTGTGTVTVR